MLWRMWDLVRERDTNTPGGTSCTPGMDGPDWDIRVVMRGLWGSEFGKDGASASSSELGVVQPDGWVLWSVHIITPSWERKRKFLLVLSTNLCYPSLVCTSSILWYELFEKIPYWTIIYMSREQNLHPSDFGQKKKKVHIITPLFI